MKVHFNHPRVLGFKKADRKLYAKGTHEVPEALADHWFFKAALQSKDVSLVSDKIEDEIVLPPQKQGAKKLVEPQKRA